MHVSCCHGRSPSTLLRFVITAIWSILALNPSMASAKTAADYYIRSLPGAPQPLLTMHAGHIEIAPEHHGNLFFWHFQNRHIADRQRTVIWLNGGPGCSSLDGALMEIGPYRVTKDGKLTMNEGSWDEFANLLFVDQPLGTGFSYVDTDSFAHGLDQVATEMVTFLEKFFELFPEYMRDDIYIAGESYAGQHIPYVARGILDRNARSEQKWNLSGLLIGNGWISGVDQYHNDLTFAYQRGMLVPGSEIAKPVERAVNKCNKDLSDGAEDRPESRICEGILHEILSASTKSPRWGGKCVNMYDIRLSDDYPGCGFTWPDDLAQMTPYLRRKDVLEALHINPDKKTGWVECSGAVATQLRNHKAKTSRLLLPDLLAAMPIILFSGDQDLICNHVGTEELINNMEWNDGKGMEISPGVWAPRLDWTFEKELVGLYQTARNLTYILFYNASHMVPYDYPRRTRDMLDRFMGVDIGSIGGVPTDSRIDGLKGVETSVGGHTNSTAAVEAEKNRLKQATSHAYYKSGEVALMVVLIAAAVWAWVVWRGRVRRARGGIAYSGLMNGLGGGRKRGGPGDIDATDFDEAELDELTSAHDGHRVDGGDDEFDVGFDSEDGEDQHHDNLERDSRGKNK